MITDAPLLVERKGVVWRATLNRPEIGNALSNELAAELYRVVAEATSNPDVRALTLCGAGRHFCTGFDLSKLDEETDESLIGRFVRVELLLQAIWNAPFRTVAVAHGRVMGAGADLFTACDERAICGDVSFAFPGAQFGVVLGTRRLVQRVGRATAVNWIQRGATINGETALSAGLATARLPTAQQEANGGRGEPEGWSADDRLDPETSRAIQRAAHRAEHRSEAEDGDSLVQLVRSLAQVGLVDRIRAYRARSKKKIT